MNIMNGIGHTSGKACSVLFCVMWFGAPVSLADGADAPSATAEYDCGTIALHMLLAIESHATRFDALQAKLPAPCPEGYSMALLRDAARTCGLSITGVKLVATRQAPDRPALVFTKWGEHGHFLVVRPVGHSGKLIQIIDSTGDPIVMDATDLYTSPQWTGLALVPTRPNWPLRVAVGVLVVSGLTFVSLWLPTGCAALRKAGLRSGLQRLLHPPP